MKIILKTFIEYEIETLLAKVGTRLSVVYSLLFSKNRCSDSYSKIKLKSLQTSKLKKKKKLTARCRGREGLLKPLVPVLTVTKLNKQNKQFITKSKVVCNDQKWLKYSPKRLNLLRL